MFIGWNDALHHGPVFTVQTVGQSRSSNERVAFEFQTRKQYFRRVLTYCFCRLNFKQNPYSTYVIVLLQITEDDEMFYLKISRKKQYVQTQPKYCSFGWNSNSTISFEYPLWPLDLKNHKKACKQLQWSSW